MANDPNIPIRFPLDELEKLDQATDKLGALSRTRYVRACLAYIHANVDVEALRPFVPAVRPGGRPRRTDPKPGE